MSFGWNVTPLCRDKKIDPLCDVIFRSRVSILINMKCRQPQNVLSCETPTTRFQYRYQLEQHILLNSIFLNDLSELCTVAKYHVALHCLSSDLLSFPFWLICIKTRCQPNKSYHCLKYTRLEHTDVSLRKAEHNTAMYFCTIGHMDRQINRLAFKLVLTSAALTFWSQC